MSVIDDITTAAMQQRVDPRLAIAIAQVESGLNPNAVGDSGHSHGLFQLNDRGEGAGWSLLDLFNPLKNATRALSQVAAVQAAHPGLDPGHIAALAQRPADAEGYARKVNEVWNQLVNGLNPFALGKAAGGTIGDLVSGAGKTASDLAGGQTIGDAISAVPGKFFGGIADGIGASTHNIGVFLQRQFIALAVAAVVLLVLFA
jgi:hypothetical protein